MANGLLNVVRVGESGPKVLDSPPVVGRESSPGVDDDAPTPKIGLIRELSSSAPGSLCEARSRFPNGEFLRPDMLCTGYGLCGGQRWWS